MKRKEEMPSIQDDASEERQRLGAVYQYLLERRKKRLAAKNSEPEPISVSYSKDSI
jgi:hypothetical protein